MTGYTSAGQSSFVSTLAQRRQAGQKILGSIGGAGGGLEHINRASILEGVANLRNILSSVPGGGLDGIDWDIEAGAGFPGSDALAVSSQLKSLYGSEFMITMAPNGTNKLAYRAAAAQMHAAGCLDWIGQQFYDAHVPLGDAKTEIQKYINAGIPEHKNGVGMYISSNPSKGWTLQQCINYMNDIRNTWPGINRVYLWTESGDIPDAIAWINAMRPIVGL